MPFADFCTKKHIIQLVKWFYESICKNKVLASIFNQHAKNWDLHLSTNAGPLGIQTVWQCPISR